MSSAAWPRGRRAQRLKTHSWRQSRSRACDLTRGSSAAARGWATRRSRRQSFGCPPMGLSDAREGAFDRFWDGDGDEKAQRVKVVLSGFVHDPNEAVSFG